MWAPPAYNDANFRQQFPAFANPAQFPEATLSFTWDMGANWLSQQLPPSWGLSASNPNQLQQAADLMGAVIARQLYGPILPSGDQTPGKTGGVSGPLNAASDNGTSASYTLPAFGSSALASLLLSSPPYGPLLLSLLQVSASVGPYIGSGRPAFVPP